ncbi:transcription factor containing a c2h2 zinc finger [Moniliophthora roreri MCA 2997]|uniref:Transcription factor containing a c2h2 zinc finger n=1 Tax=Moniliophthora roreri (strain MCA 2997) TaxID=1381753 RepID=V2WDT0_MONRO|nr:transcription factor containing a c2h2 zinc finger [Moniliophthora roreri MCA 2997]
MSASRRYQSDSQVGTDERESRDLTPPSSNSAHNRRTQSEYRPTGVAAGPLLSESSDVVGGCDVESGYATHDGLSGWDDQIFFASETGYSQNLLGEPHTGYDFVSPSGPQSSGPTTDAIPDSSYHYIQLDANTESSTSTHGPHPGSHDTHPFTPTVSTSPDSGGWYCATSPCSSTGDSVESVRVLDPRDMIPRSFKLVVASGNVLDASIQRRKDRKSDGKYRCRGFGTCKATFTASHNLKNHIRSHRGERPFKCNFCPQRTVTRSDIKRHEKKCKLSIIIPLPPQA